MAEELNATAAVQPSAQGGPGLTSGPGTDGPSAAAGTAATTENVTGARTATQRARRRQRRVPGGRHRPVHVRVSDDEHVRLSARAAAAGLSLPAWLVAAGMADRGGAGRDVGGDGAGGRSFAGGSMSALERRAWAAEFVAVRRLARGVATNVNQLAAGYNATGEVGTELHAVLDAARRVMDRMDDLGARLAGEGEGDDALDEDPAGGASVDRSGVRA
ncbi:hypothetical protein [Pseudokineococcus sp. 1T1Z-3]|uniref:hypothetical protein n=1 Tax=Pseudokineococcus sp. 1T1Z-3 TaxID=3132745 RepID=UPI003096B4B6